MNFLNRLYYFSTGLIIGVVFLVFILNGKRASCNYGPNARVIDNITSKNIILNDSLNNQYSIDELLNILIKGKVIFSESLPNEEPCGIYLVESNDLSLTIKNCDEEAIITIN
ncbi:MAG: hypothetical protein VW371_05855 [Bacteroidota bacterium]